MFSLRKDYTEDGVRVNVMNKIFYIEMLPHEFQEAVEKMPVAYLPLGTLEWHGPHLPLGADGIQSEGLFARIAQRIGGVVCPKLFLGPDSSEIQDGKEYYGMDLASISVSHDQNRHLVGSAYWVPLGVYYSMLDAIAKQLCRAGFRILVAHGHGPSVDHFQKLAPTFRERYGLICLDCWYSPGETGGDGFQVDHAAANETSITWGLRPDLVDMGQLPAEGVLLGVNGEDPREHASQARGEQILEAHTQRMIQKILQAKESLQA